MRGKKKLIVRSLAGAMSASMVLSLCPMTALAAGSEWQQKLSTITGLME